MNEVDRKPSIHDQEWWEENWVAKKLSYPRLLCAFSSILALIILPIFKENAANFGWGFLPHFLSIPILFLMLIIVASDLLNNILKIVQSLWRKDGKLNPYPLFGDIFCICVLVGAKSNSY